MVQGRADKLVVEKVNDLLHFNDGNTFRNCHRFILNVARIGYNDRDRLTGI